MYNSTDSLGSTFYTGTNSQTSFYSDRNLSYAKPQHFPPLGSRLDDLGVSIPYYQRTEMSELERRADGLNDRIYTSQASFNEKLQACASRLTKITDRTSNELITIDALNDSRLRGMGLIGDSVVGQMQAENQKSRENRAQILDQTRDKIFSMKLNVIQEQKATGANMRKTYLKLEDQVVNLHEQIKEERSTRIEENKKLINQVGSRLDKVKGTLQTEKRVRKEIDDLLLKSVEDLNRTLKTRVKAENENREFAEEQMIKLLETACNKIEDQALSTRRRSSLKSLY